MADLCNVTNISTDSLVLGDRICMALYIREFTTTDDGKGKYRFSAPACYTITKSPSLQIRGADSKSGAAYFGPEILLANPADQNSLPQKYQGGFTGGSSSNPNRGSWSQYGLISNGPITSFGSTGYTQNGKTATSGNKAKACQLLFANTSGDRNRTSQNCTGDVATNANEKYGTLGVRGRVITLPKTANKSAAELDKLADPASTANLKVTDLAPKTSAGAISLTNLDSGVYYIKSSSLVITTSVLSPDQHLTIVAPTDTATTITIAGNITAATDPATGAYADLAKIPSLTIIANGINVLGYNISIGGNNGSNQPITNLYGTFIARDSFKTCTAQYQYNSPAGIWDFVNDSGHLSGTTATPISQTGQGLCSGQLTITGAIISKNRPQFLRTHGAGKDDTTVPAEILQYTPNLYLTAFAQSQQGAADTWTIGTVRELPARL
jgi:hypothetical protein